MNATGIKAKPIVICSICCCTTSPKGVPEVLWVKSNVRRFRSVTFPVWRCHDCGSIHAARQVDPKDCYRDYPSPAPQTLGWRRRLAYRNQLRRLRDAGLRRDARILDYGCGGGAFVAYLKKRGYHRADGYDPHNPAFASEAPLWRGFDMVLAQDVLSHVPNVAGVIRDLRRLLLPGGVLVVGMPNAAAINLGKPDEFAHALHQPFHRKILSREALVVLAHRHGLALEREYHTMYVNTRIPFLNERFQALRLSCADNTLDADFESISPWNRRLWTLKAIFLAFFGSFVSERTNMAAVFRAGARAARPSR